MARIGSNVAIMAAIVAALAAIGRGQSVFRWTDEKGVVHFADVPPPQGQGVVKQEMPAVPPAPATAAAVMPAAPGGQVGTAARARVVLTDQRTEALGPDRQSFSGTVKNEGGREARDVVVTVIVHDSVQGAECLNEEIEVEPATLPSGAEGTFEAEFKNPCFFGATDASLRTEWR